MLLTLGAWNIPQPAHRLTQRSTQFHHKPSKPPSADFLPFPAGPLRLPNLSPPGVFPSPPTLSSFPKSSKMSSSVRVPIKSLVKGGRIEAALQHTIKRCPFIRENQSLLQAKGEPSLFSE